MTGWHLAERFCNMVRVSATPAEHSDLHPQLFGLAENLPVQGSVSSRDRFTGSSPDHQGS
jgi:hypothetical protein